LDDLIAATTLTNNCEEVVCTAHFRGPAKYSNTKIPYNKVNHTRRWAIFMVWSQNFHLPATLGICHISLFHGTSAAWLPEH
jgi:hypothetical protein